MPTVFRMATSTISTKDTGGTRPVAGFVYGIVVVASKVPADQIIDKSIGIGIITIGPVGIG